MTIVTNTTRTRHHLVAMLVLAAVTLAFHGWSLRDGLFLDDHWHRVQLEHGGWSLADLIDASTIEPAEFVHTWWQDKPVRWQYPRPFAMLVMKTVHHLSGGSVAAQHAVSILLHLANVLMVYALCLLLSRRVFWSTVAGLILAVYSHSFTSVAWLAAQNALLQTALMLAALLCYIRASGLRLLPHDERGNADQSRPLRMRPYFAALILWCLAVASRENALVAPVIFAAFDLAFGGRRHLWNRLRALAPFIALAAAWAVWRLANFDPMPDVYFRRPDGPGYLLWLAVKLLHYLTSAIWHSPMTVGPSGRYNPISEVPGDCLLMLAIVAIMSFGYYLAARRARGWWIWPLWILLGVLPVLPVMATPHTGYMLGVGYAIAMVLGPGVVQRPTKALAARRWSAKVAIGFLIAMSICAPIHRALWTAFPAAERLAIEQIGMSPPPDATETHLFLINLPFVNIYLQPTLTSLQSAGQPNLECHVLTYAPDALRADQSCRIEQLDPYSFSLSSEGTPFFAGFLGRFLLDGMSHGGRLETGQIVTGELFDVEITEASESGVQRLIFSFHEPLASESFRFYVASPVCAAARLTFASGDSAAGPIAVAPKTVAQVTEIAERIEAGDVAALDDLLAGLSSTNPTVRRAAAAEFVNRVMPVVDALGGPPDVSPSEIRDWWHAHVRDGALRDIQRGRREFSDLRRRLQMLYTIIESAARIIRSDLYLTGPPFPGPK